MRWQIIIIILQILTLSSALAAEAKYTPTVRFMPLPPPKINSPSQHKFAPPPAKFFPITQSRYPVPMQLQTGAKDNMVKNAEVVLPDSSDKIISENKANMSQEQAQQIISIFATKQ